MTLSVRDQVRLLIGDHDEDAALFTNDELDQFLANRAQNVYLTAADCCESLAIRFARAYDFETDGQSFKRSQMSQAYSDRADELRDRVSGVVTVDATRKDGYSDDVVNRDTALTSGNPKRRFRLSYAEDELP